MNREGEVADLQFDTLSGALTQAIHQERKKDADLYPTRIYWKGHPYLMLYDRTQIVEAADYDV